MECACVVYVNPPAEEAITEIGGKKFVFPWKMIHFLSALANTFPAKNEKTGSEAAFRLTPLPLLLRFCCLTKPTAAAAMLKRYRSSVLSALGRSADPVLLLQESLAGFVATDSGDADLNKFFLLELLFRLSLCNRRVGFVFLIEFFDFRDFLFRIRYFVLVFPSVPL